MNYTTQWLTDKTRVKELVDFFITHKTDSYISHGEMMSGRAIDSHHWNPDLDVILTEQLLTDFNSDGSTKLNILIAEDENKQIVGMMVFNVINSPFKKYAILEDMLLDQSVRGQSLGSKLLEKAIEESKNWNISFILLESGVDNHGAHHFFGKYGFQKVSESYILTL
ncbi:MULTISPECIES: GNAT family N-acetyltransferase [Chryseobacterium]|uniref:GNAT family N-acetyltransferase n=1 Tax=Chryseobacterium pennae TaxID=2258962 RepID=A0A3D9C7B4_9FLAO|nr:MULTISPECIES: GNAT family N-acetyltransferase [Chryseobacterium]MCS4305598.1 ribosomal protein S18 acetylase RimI-like enzyme [Chryseobacterium sp. BIGb0232]REC61644.1 GNAT family N-acetyltransferase [Chryseobacterium pennae]ROS20790.1 acetyltransferase (GNAT) family protein [Chryseobacterium nakagawai]